MAQLVIDLHQEGPEFDLSVDEDGNAVQLPNPPPPIDSDLDAIIARGEAEIAGIEAEIAAVTSRIALPVDREDNQRNIHFGEDHISYLPEGENFISWACAANVGGVSVAPTYTFSKTQITCRLRLRHPDEQRGAAVLEIRAPRDPHAEDNPARQLFHIVHIKMPSRQIEQLTYNEMAHHKVHEHFTQFAKPASLDSTQAGTVEILAGQAIVQGVVVPKLLTPRIQTQIDDIIQQALATTSSQALILRAVLQIGDDSCARQEADLFVMSMNKEKRSDPIDPWFAGAPRTQVLNVGNITKILRRPDIPLQRAETVYADAKEYQMHHIYSAAYENDFNKLAVTGFEDVDFNAKMISMTSSILGPGGLPTTYLCFVDLHNLGVEGPEVGSRLKVTLDLPMPEPQVPHEADTDVPNNNTDVWENDNEAHSDSHDDDNEFFEDNLEEQDNYFEDREDDLANHKNPNLWNGTVIECVLTPLGYLCCMLERRREPSWRGDADSQPFVLTNVPCISDHYKNLYAIEKALEKAPIVTVAIKPDFSQQRYRDEIRSCDTLFSSKFTHKMALREYIICPTKEDNSPVNLLSEMGPLDSIKDFSPSQMKYYESLGSIKKGISLLNAPFGTGKTTVALSIMLKLQSRKEKSQVVYTTSSNIAVDDAARRYAKLAAKHNMTHLKVICAHSPKSEEAAVFHGKGRKSRFGKVDDAILNEFLAAAYITELGNGYETKRKICVVEDLSLAVAMVAFMNNHLYDLALQRLKEELVTAAKHGMEGLDRVQIRAEVNTLMARTLQDADAVFCTLDTITKVIMIDNLNPVLIVNDESCRATELAVLALFAHYSPKAWMFLGDPNQLHPTLLSAGREKKFCDPPFLNPFQRTGTTSFLERMIQCGHPFTMLTEQFRCQGGNAYFAVQNFYYGMVKDANAGKPINPSVAAIRRFTKEFLNLPKGSNVVLLAVEHSKSFRAQGSTSTINPDHISAVVDLVNDLLEYDDFKTLDGQAPGSVTIAPMYRAQVNGYIKAIQEDKELDKSRIKVRTIDGMQGWEDDAVIVDLTRSRGAGFTGQRNRFTVACTRAILLFVMVVNPHMLDAVEKASKMESTKFIDKFITFCSFTKKDVWMQADSFFCRACRKPGHSAKDCADKLCRNCDEPGHDAKECPALRNMSKATCRNCNEIGHEAKACKAPKSMANVTCRNCSTLGHFSRDCPQPKKPFCRNCKTLGHIRAACPEAQDASNIRCDRCGILGHFSRTCSKKLTLRLLHEARQDQRNGPRPAIQWTAPKDSHDAGWDAKVVQPGNTQDFGWGGEKKAPVDEDFVWN
jgi:hypothetical protein